VLNIYLTRCKQAFKTYLTFTYYSFKNGYPIPAFWFFLSALSGLVLMYRLVGVFEDMAAIYLDPVGYDIIGQDMFGDE